ncbi:hypothetical protein [Nostoc sp. KVJ20]|uniref:hypothetical protein n=1 Tax=Nostoc sp. KVJ20 TaxID=457944 RepID=UPI00114C8860|nr:hypothetical protein [Nostoc sp. KVJ20]
MNTNSINDCNTSLGKDAIHRVSTNGLFVAFFFQIGITLISFSYCHKIQIPDFYQKSGRDAI